MARSPNYPHLNLEDAIQRARTIWEIEDRNEVNQKVVAEHLGYSGLTGSANVTISAMRKFGLLEGKGDALRISTDALILLEGSKDHPEYRETVERAAFSPNLFAELRNEYSGRPSEKNLSFQLLRKGFTKSAASKAAKTYLETLDFVAEVNTGYTEPSNEDSTDKTTTRQAVRAVHTNLVAGPARLHASSGGSGMKQDVYPLSTGDVVLQWPTEMSSDDLDEFKDWLTLVTKKVTRTVRSLEKESKEKELEGGAEEGKS